MDMRNRADILQSRVCVCACVWPFIVCVYICTHGIDAHYKYLVNI